MLTMGMDGKICIRVSAITVAIDVRVAVFMFLYVEAIINLLTAGDVTQTRRYQVQQNRYIH